MKFAVALLALLVTTSAFAQEKDQSQVPTEKVAPAPAPAPTKYYLELDQADVVAIGAALNELPKRVADPLILKFNGQLSDQAQPAVKEAAEKARKVKK